MPEASAYLAAALRGPCAAPPAADWPDLLVAARDHGVLPIVARAAAHAGWPPELCDRLRADAASETAHALLRRHELHRVVAVFSNANVPVFLIKGAHLESVCYETPDLRPRSDTDLLIRETDRGEVRRLLTRIGYQPAAHVRGTVAFTQFHFIRQDPMGAVHRLDIHWRISNPAVFASRLRWSDFWTRRAGADGLPPGVFAPSLTLALALACIHRVAHHGCSERLIWLCDIHRIVTRLTDRDLHDLVHLATDRRLLQVVASGIDATMRQLATRLPAWFVTRLRDARDADVEVARFLSGSLRPIEVLRSDWRQLRGLGARITFLREHLFPDADVIRSRYGVSTTVGLPFLYAHRLAAGAFRWL